MITGKRRHGAVAWILTAVMVATCIFAGSPMSAEAAPVQSQPTIDRAAQWEEVQSLIGRYQGEWNDSTYPGLITNRIPQTALLGNGDVGVTSGGDSLSKNFYISKGDFWRFKGSPVPIGGVKIAPVLDVEPPKVSLAQGKPATANSSHGSFPAQRAVSGEWGPGYEGWVSNNDRTNGAASTANPWILTINLQEPVAFNHYIVRHDGDARPAETANNTKDFNLEISDNGADWTAVDQVRGNTASRTDKMLDAPATATWLRLVILKGIQNDTAANPRARIGQLEIYLEDVANENSIVDLALNKTATASTQLSGSLGPQRAIDGNYGYRSGREGWASQGSSAAAYQPQWLMVDLGEEKTFNRYIVAHDGAVRNAQTNNPYAFEIQTSHDEGEAKTWTTVSKIENNTAELNDVILDAPVTARYVRFYVTDPVQPATTEKMARCGAFKLYNQPDLLSGITGTVSGDWTVYDLGARWKAGSYRFNTKSGNPAGVVLQYSREGTTWKTADEIATLQDQTLRAFGPYAARYWRVKADPGADKLQLFSSSDPEKLNSALNEVEDILNAEIRTRFMADENRLNMRTFMTATENLLVTEIKSGSDFPIPVDASLWASANNTGTFPVSAAASPGSVTVSRTANPADANSEVQADPYYSKATLEAKIIGADFTTKRDNNSQATMNFVLEPDATVYVVTAIGGGGRVYQRSGSSMGPLWPGATEPDVESAQLLSLVTGSGDVAALESAHDQWWKDYWMRSYVAWELTDSKLDTIMKYYYAAQYLLGSGLRDGNVAAGLYGIWHTNDSPSWNSDYHLNYNFVSAYYGVSSSNRPELNLPAVDALIAYMEQGRWNSANTAVVRRILAPFVDYKVSKGDIDSTGGIPGGILYPVGIGPFGFDLDLSFHCEALNAGFSAYPMLEYYNFTKDKVWLKESGTYDFIKGCLAFYEKWLEKKDGKYLLYAGYNEGSWAINAAVELSVVKLLARNAIYLSRELGEDADLREGWQEILDNLSPQPTITMGSGQFQGREVFALAELEWPNFSYGSQTNTWTTADDQWRPMTSPVPADGNIIPMEAVIPGEVMGYYSSQQQLDIAKNTIDVFSARGAWSQINNFPKIYPVAVNTRYPAQSIIDNLSNTIRNQMKLNLTIDDNVHGFEKAGNVESVNNMMLLSDQDVVKVFPNWIQKDAKFVNLREKGAFIVSSEYDGVLDQVKYVDVISEAGEDLTLASPWEKGIRVLDEAGKSVPAVKGTAPNHPDEITYTFPTEKGARYYITEGGEKADDFLVTLLADLAGEAEALDEDNYLPDAWATLSEALEKAAEILDDPDYYTGEEVLGAVTQLLEALQELYQNLAANKASLREAIAEAEKLLAAEDQYIPLSVAGLKEKLEAAKQVNENGAATQSAVDQAFLALGEAIANVFEKGDKRALQALVNLLAIYKEGNYTPATWEVFRSAMDEAGAVLLNENAVKEQVDAAVGKLTDAVKSLVRKADVTALQSALTAAKSILDHVDDYVASTLIGLAGAYEDAKQVRENPNATQAQVNAATSALNGKILSARLKPDKSQLLSLQKQGQGLNLSLYTAATAKAVQTALVSAKSILDRGDERLTQAEVDAATETLKAAIGGLIPAAKTDATGKAGTSGAAKDKSQKSGSAGTGTAAAAPNAPAAESSSAAGKEGVSGPSAREAGVSQPAGSGGQGGTAAGSVTQQADLTQNGGASAQGDEAKSPQGNGAAEKQLKSSPPATEEETAAPQPWIGLLMLAALLLVGGLITLSRRGRRTLSLSGSKNPGEKTVREIGTRDYK